MENFVQNYVKLDIFGTFLFKKGVNPKSLVAALSVLCNFLRRITASFPGFSQKQRGRGGVDVPHVPHRRRPALPPEELRDGDLQAEPGRPHRLPQVERLVEGLQRGSFEAEREDEGLLFHVLQNLAM